MDEKYKWIQENLVCGYTGHLDTMKMAQYLYEREETINDMQLRIVELYKEIKILIKKIERKND